MSKTTTSFGILLCGLLLITLATGCSSWGGLSGLGRNKSAGADERFNPLKAIQGDKEPQYVTPDSMVAIWKSSVFEKPGQKSVRGFGGRFYFYNRQNVPVRIKGDLTIYGYDDDKHKSTETTEHAKADRKFVFKADSINTHYSESALGASYSFWVPWDEVGGDAKTITLIPVFKSADGKIPEAKPSTIRLPGKKRSASTSQMSKSNSYGDKKAAGVIPERSMIQQASFEETGDDNERRAPTTFRLPPRLAEQMAQPRGHKDEIVIEEPKPVAMDPADTATLKPLERLDRQPHPTVRGTKVFGQPGAFR